jgi:hypothetical protein
MLSPEVKIKELAAADLAALEINRLRDLCRRKLRRPGCVAIVRTSDYRIFIPIVKWGDGRFGRSLPQYLAREGHKPGPKISRAQVIEETSRMILEIITPMQLPEVRVVVEQGEKREARARDPSRFPAPCAAALELPEGFQIRGAARNEAPFVWGTEAAFERIDGSDIKNKGTVKLTYLAHIRIANEVRSCMYRTHIVHLEKRSGLKERAVQMSNQELVRLNLLYVHRGMISGTRANDVNVYALLTTCCKDDDEGAQPPVHVMHHLASGVESLAHIAPHPPRVMRGGSGAPTAAGAGPLIYEKKKQSNTSTRVLAPKGEQRLLEEMKSAAGAEELDENGGIWRTRIRGGKDEIRAIRHTIEDFNIRTPDQRAGIRNRGAWFNDRYLRNLVEVREARAKAGAA